MSLTRAPSGAISAAAITSLPEVPGDSWNRDDRFTWTTVRSLVEAGFPEEAEAFERLAERSSAGSGSELPLPAFSRGRSLFPSNCRTSDRSPADRPAQRSAMSAWTRRIVPIRDS